MAIGMIELQGGITRTQDFTQLKHQEDIRPMVEQDHLQHENDKRVDSQHNQVQSGDDSAKSENRADAKEKGKNQYAGDGGARRKKQEKQPEGKVVQKGVSHFDMSV